MNSRRFIENITFVVFTYNELARIGRVIKNFEGYGQILVVDNCSTDGTAAYARAHGCAVVVNKNEGWVEDFKTAERVKAEVKTDWIYWAYADEMVPIKVLEDLRLLIASHDYDVISIARKNFYQGVFCYDAFLSFAPRAFKKDAIDFRDNTILRFGKIVTSSSRTYTMSSRNYVYHFISNTTATYLNTINTYTELDISGKNWGSLRVGFELCKTSFKIVIVDFILRRGYKAGAAGIQFSFLMMLYSIVKYMRQYERKHGITRTQIESRNDEIRDAILKELNCFREPALTKPAAVRVNESI